MISAVDQGKLLRLGDRVHQFLQLGARPELIACSTDEKLGQSAIPQEIVSVNSWFFFVRNDRSDGHPHADQRLHPGIGTRSSQSNCSTKGESSKDEGQAKFRIEPVQSCADIIDFS